MISLLSLIVISYFNPIAYGESAEAYLSMTPPMCIAQEIGEIFDVGVNISSVENLQCCWLTVTYNTSLLDVAEVVQGSFFPLQAVFEFEKNEPYGFVTVNISLSESDPPLSGNGTLAQITFEVAEAPTTCAASVLKLDQTQLYDSSLQPIDHSSVSAIYFWKSIHPDPPEEKRLLDLYTQKGGEGLDQPGGDFATGELVYLTSNVTYGGWPEQKALLAFQVLNPINETILVRINITDQEGLAEISFMIPSIPSSIGVWTAISVVEIAENIVWDTLSFRVYSIIPVGGYTYPMEGYTTEKPLALYLALVAILTVFTTIKLKTHKRLRRNGHRRAIFTLLLLFLLLRFNVFFGAGEGADVLIIGFYSCDRLGDPQDYFPMKTTAYFNITIRNLAYNPENVSIYISVLDELNVPIGLDGLNTTVPPDASTYYIMSVFIPKWAHVGVATAYASVHVKGILVDGESTEFYIGPEDLTPPVLRLLSPKNVTYGTESVPLVFTVNERTFWMGYSLNHMENASIAGNTTLTGLANGPYSIIVYANDTSGNVGSSEEVYFTIFVVHDMAVVDLTCSCAGAYLGEIVSITVSVQNEGTVTETFNVTAYANSAAIETLTVTNLFPSNQTTLVFAWNTTGWAKGNYTISAIANPVLDETDTADNTYIGSIVNIMPRPDIAVTNVTYSKTSVGQGYSIPISVTVRNQGDYTESFNVTAYANTTVIQTKTATLTSGNSTTIAFVWNTTGFAKGNYTIWAYAWPVQGETYTTDNTLTGGIITVTIPGDVDGDRDVDILDVVKITSIYAIRLGDPRFRPNSDIDGDGRITILDVVICTSHCAQEDP